MEGGRGYRLRIEGPGIEVDQAVSGAQVLKILARTLRDDDGSADILRDDERGELAVELGPAGEALRRAIYERDGPERMRTFLSQMPTRTNDEKIAAFALFMAEHGDPTHVSRAKLPNCFHAAGFTIPRNLMRDVRKAIEKGWVEEQPDGSELYRITEAGTAHLRGNSK